MAADRRLTLCPACLTQGWQRAKSDQPAPAAVFEIPGYEIAGEIARGGMGVVYRARQKHPQREVAVKMLMPQVALDDMRERFRIEAKVMADLVHPGIVPIYQYGEHTGVPWISMALCARGSLAERKDEYRGQWRRIAELIASLAEAVSFAHAHGVLHRDLKPGNVLFSEDGRAFLSDFGLAKIVTEHSDLTRTISLVGTPHYLAPELIDNASQATTASDVYALGAILYELLAGGPPFDGQNVAAILKQISEKDAAPLGKEVPRDLATIALKCLSKSPAQRYATAQAFADDLKRWLSNQPIAARRMSVNERLVFWCKRKPALATMSVLLVISVLGAALTMLLKNRELAQSLRVAEAHRREALIGEARVIRRQMAVFESEHALKNIAEVALIREDDDLREEAAALLSLPSFKLVETTSRSTNYWMRKPDPALRCWVDFSDEKSAKIIERASDRELALLPPGRAFKPAYSSAFDPSGRFVCYRQSVPDQLVVVEWATGKTLLALPSAGYEWPVLRSGPELIVANSGRIEHRDLRGQGKATRVWESPSKLKEPVLLSLSPDERWLGVGDNKLSPLFIFDVEAGKVRAEYNTVSNSHVVVLGWSGAGEAFIEGTADGMFNGYINDPASLSRRVLPDHYNLPRAVCWHPRGDLLVTAAADNRTQVLHTATLRPLGKLAASGSQTTFFDEGRRLLVDNPDFGQQLWYEVKLSKVCREYSPPETMSGGAHNWGGNAVSFINNGQMLLVRDGGYAQFYDVVSGRRLVRLSDAGQMNVWDETARSLWLCGSRRGHPWQLSEERDGEFQLKRGKPLDVYATIGREPSGAASASILASPSLDVWVLRRDGDIFFARESEKVESILHVPPRNKSDPPPVLAFQAATSDGRLLALADEKQGLLVVVDVLKRRLVHRLELPEPANIGFSGDESSLWLVERARLRKLRVGTWKEELVINDSNSSARLRSPAVSPDGRLLATIDDRTLELRDAHTGNCFLKLRHPLAIPLGAAAFSPDGAQLACACLGQVTLVWDLHELMTEFRRLGLTWPGPEMKVSQMKAVKSLRVQTE